MKKSNNNMPIVFYVGLLLVCLTFFSVHMSSGLYARYVSRASGSDDARVAKFDCSASEILEENLIVTLDPGEIQTYKFAFTNSGETTLVYKVELINTTGNLPLTLTGASGMLAIGGAEQIVECSVEWETESETGDPTAPVYAGMLDLITVRVIIEQVD